MQMVAEGEKKNPLVVKSGRGSERSNAGLSAAEFGIPDIRMAYDEVVERSYVNDPGFCS